MYTKKFPRLFFVLALLTTAILVIAGCSSSSKKSSTTSGASISITASPTTVTTGNTSIVEATITEDGAAVADVAVTFTVSPSTAGFFTPSVDTTDANGTVATVFTATTSGAVTVTCSAAGLSLSKTVALAIEQSQDDTGTGNINVAVTPSLLTANGVDSATVRVTVRDALGQPAPESTLVKLVAGEKFADLDGNGYWSVGADSLIYDANSNDTWDALGLVPSVAYTDADGIVSVNYLSATDAVTVYIKATVQDNGITGHAETQLQLTPNATINSIYLASDTMNLSVKQTGGIESGTLRAIGYDINGNPVPEGLTVYFIITDGPERAGLANAHIGNVGYGPYKAVTNSQGQAVATIHSGQVSGTVRIRAYTDTVLSNATQVMVSAGPPAHIVVGASETCNVPYWYEVGSEVKILAVVSDVYLNPVNDSTVVYFTCDEGTVMSHMLRTKDDQGLVESRWFSGNNVDSADGVVWIIAETSGGTVRDSSFFYNTGTCQTVLIGSHPTSVIADGKAKFSVTVTGLDINGNPMPAATAVKTKADFIKTADGDLQDGCMGSSAIIDLQSATLDADYSVTGGNDDGIGATDVVTFRVGFASASFSINLATGTTARSMSTINAPSSIDTGKTVDISVTIKDRWGNPLADHTLTMTATAGTVTSATHETDMYGEAYGFRYRAPATAGTQTISVTDSDPRGGGVILTIDVSVSAPS